MLRTRISTSALASIGISSLLVSSMAFAQDGHGDVEFSYQSGKIEIEFGDEGRVFEGDFSDLAGGPDETEAPGYGSEIAEGLGIDPDDIVGFKVLGPLLYHDGVSFSPTAATITIEPAVGADVLIDSITTSGGGVIAQADGDGDVHAHIDYLINNSAPTGAYGVLLALTAFDENFEPRLDIADSDSFYIVFNRGLDEETFEGAVGAFAAQVPEPTSLALLGVGLAAWAMRRKRAA
jgi:hypothetical protein